MGMSLGSVIASCFAHQRPDLMDRMILMGVMQKTRKSWRMILKNPQTHARNRMEEFGQAVILYLVNHAKLDKTRMSPTAKSYFLDKWPSLRGLSENVMKLTVIAFAVNRCTYSRVQNTGSSRAVR